MLGPARVRNSLGETRVEDRERYTLAAGERYGSGKTKKSQKNKSQGRGGGRQLFAILIRFGECWKTTITN